MLQLNPRRLLACSISEVLYLFDWFLSASSGLRILMYHAVGTKALGDTRGLFSISPALFKQHMQLLSQWSAGRIVELTSNSLKNDGCRISITFDDGYEDNFEIAAPILYDLGLPFTVFVTSEFVRSGKKGFLSPSSLRALAGLPNVTIGSHGANHIAMTECNEETLMNELLSSKLYLEDLIGSEVKSVAYPYGAANMRVRNAAFAAGYQLGACSLAGTNSSSRDPLMLARTEIVSLDSDRVFSQKIQGSWDWYRWRSQDPACL